MDRRKTVTRIIERTAVAIVVLDVVLYFAVLLPLQRSWQARAERYNTVRLQVLNEEARVNRLKWYTDAVPSMRKDVDDFLSNEVRSKRKSFSRTTRLVLGLADQTGVSLPPSAINYQMDPQHDQLLDRMSLNMTVKGPFKNLLDFAHELETTTDDFLVLRGFSFEAGEGPDLSLRLATDFYLTP
ncbi:MAG TPA: hypothetical protein VG028_00665 [Terriglobia bacterium]|nr:hypothetical protein [Terriglobia bacterium]